MLIILVGQGQKWVPVSFYSDIYEKLEENDFLKISLKMQMLKSYIYFKEPRN